YDNAGHLLTVRDRNGSAVHYAYDGDGFLMAEDAGDTRNDYEHDPLGRLTRAGNASAVVDLGYDNVSNLVTQRTTGTDTASQPTVEMRYGYDKNGRLTSVNGPAGLIGYDYDALGDLTAVPSSTLGDFGCST